MWYEVSRWQSRLTLICAFGFVCLAAVVLFLVSNYDDLTLEPGMVVERIRVRAGMNGPPVAGAKVKLTRRTEPTVSVASTTDSKGWAVFKLPKEKANPGVNTYWEALAWADGYSTSPVHRGNGFFMGHRSSIWIEPLARFPESKREE